MMSKLKPHFLCLVKAGRFPALVFFIHCVLSIGFKAYDRLTWLDVPMHVLGGAAIAYFIDIGIEHLDRLDVVRVGNRQAAVIMVFGLVAASTVVWEFAEFIADAFFNAGAQRSVANVMKDQFMGLVGGITYIGFFSKVAGGALTRASGTRLSEDPAAFAAERKRNEL